MKDKFYFPHDYNSRNDEKILMARAEFNNAEAFGMYWMIVESMAETRDGFLNRVAIAPLSLSLGISSDRLEAFVSLCVKIGLFFDQNGRYSAHRMVEHKRIRFLLSKSGKKGNKIRWPKHRPPNPKERKGKESKQEEETPLPPKGGNVVLIPEDLNPNEPEIRDWLDYKKQKGQTYKSKGLEALWRCFRAIPADKRREAVDHSMANNWAGLFQKNGGNNGNHRQQRTDEERLKGSGKFAGVTEEIILS